MKKIYLAGPFFNQYERDLITKAAEILRNREYDVTVPMEHIIEGGDKMTNEEWSRHVFQYDVARIRECDIVIAIYHDVNNIASIMPVSGCSCNIRFEDLEK